MSMRHTKSCPERLALLGALASALKELFGSLTGSADDRMGSMDSDVMGSSWKGSVDSDGSIERMMNVGKDGSVIRLTLRELALMGASIGSLLLAATPFLLAWGGTRYRPGVPADA